MKSINLNNETKVDLLKMIDSKLLIQANSGGGKSWAIRRIVEEAFGKVQIIMIDTEGEFANLRKDNEFILVGKGADAPADPRSAELLARRLLELRASAIIDLYELIPRERRHFVKLFFQALVNAPKELWPINHGDCLLILDEAHIFAPEHGESEALDAVTSVSSLGRKRGIGLVLATQRIAKLNKDAAAECNNKLVGRASLDIDRKRAADEIGFTSKEDILSLRNLEPGEFYAFGPAISRDIAKIRIGDIKAKPPGRGKGVQSLPAPTEKVKAILAKLADLPQEAANEAKTVSELKADIVSLRREMATKIAPKPVQIAAKPTQKDIDAALAPHIIAFESVENAAKNTIKNLEAYMDSLDNIMRDFQRDFSAWRKARPSGKIGASYTGRKIQLTTPKNPIDNKIVNLKPIHPFPARMAPEIVNDALIDMENDRIGKGEIVILKAIAQYPEGITNEHIAVLTGYKKTSRRVYLQKLAARSLTRVEGELIFSTDEGIEALGSDFRPLPSGEELRKHWMQTLPEGEKRILGILIDSYPETVQFEDIERISNYKTTSRRTYLQKLSARKLVEIDGQSARASDKLF